MAVQKHQYADYLSYDPLPVLQILNLVIRPREFYTILQRYFS